jgi:hypothetical protein
MGIVRNVIDSVVAAASIDDSQLEDELDAFYPRWSRTDLEFDPRRYQRLTVPVAGCTVGSSPN